MSTADRTLREKSVRQHCRLLRLPTVAAQFGRLADEAMKQQYGPVRYLEALLAAELEERERSAIARRIFEAKLPRVKTLEEFDFGQAPQISAAHSSVGRRRLYPESRTIGVCGRTGHREDALSDRLCVAACRQRRRARFTTTTALVNDLVEAKHANQLSRALGRWSRYELIVIDELGYVPLAEVGAELLFQVIADRAEKALDGSSTHSGDRDGVIPLPAHDCIAEERGAGPGRRPAFWKGGLPLRPKRAPEGGAGLRSSPPFQNQ